MFRVIIFILTATLSSSSIWGDNPDYINESFVRLNYITGNAYIQKAADLAYEEAVRNMPLTEGDRLGTTTGKVELYLENGNYLRLNNETKIDLTRLPDTESDLIQVRIWSGNVYLSIQSVKREKSIEIHTPDASFYVLDKGLYRVDVDQASGTEISVYMGVVEAAGEIGSVLVNEDHWLNAEDGRFSERPARLVADSQDNFDIWSEQREEEVRKHLAKRYLPSELGGYETELNEYGSWAYDPEFGHVWIPGGTGPDWKPYYHGRWIWISLSGWTWLPYEPWGWVTYHYGRWHWNAGLGWYWIPTVYWGPAWVSWYWWHDYWAWSPLSYWGYPGVIINNIYYGKYQNEIPLNTRTLTMIHKNQLQARDISKTALTQDSIKSLDKIKLSPRTPNIRPEDHAISRETLDENKFLLKKDPGVSGVDPGMRRIPIREDLEQKSIDLNSRSKINSNTSSTNERNILRRPTGYPSSPSISRSRISGSTSSRYIKPRSSLSRFYDYISKGSSRYLKTVPKDESKSREIIPKGSSKINVPPVTSRQSSRPQTSNKSSSRSSTSKSSGSSKTKKKK